MTGIKNESRGKKAKERQAGGKATKMMDLEQI
jgi:hypothetical protein